LFNQLKNTKKRKQYSKGNTLLVHQSYQFKRVVDHKLLNIDIIKFYREKTSISIFYQIAGIIHCKTNWF
jgi:hypothetical protein